METIKISLENCYGIGQFNFDWTSQNLVDIQ